MKSIAPNYVAAAGAAPMMIASGGGLTVSISFSAARKYYGNVAHGAAKAADAMSRDMAHELRQHGVAVVSLYPGHVIGRKKGKIPRRETAQFVGARWRPSPPPLMF